MVVRRSQPPRKSCYEAHDHRRTLFKEDDILLLQSKVVTLSKELFGRFPGGSTGHDVPRHGLVGASDDLKTLDALGLKLEQALARRKTNVVASLGSRATKSSALSSGHEQHADLALANGGEAQRVPLCTSSVVVDDASDAVGRRR